MRSKTIAVAVMLLWSAKHANALEFNEAARNIPKHDSVQAIEKLVEADREKANLKGSWGDPRIKFGVKNLPNENPGLEASPMSGAEIQISQKIPLTSKYADFARSATLSSYATKAKAEFQKRVLLKLLWQTFIDEKKLQLELDLLETNLAWTRKMQDVSKKLYSNGRLSQQAIYDIQIRISEIDSDLEATKYLLKANQAKLSYLVGSPQKINIQSAPWSILVDPPKSSSTDAKEIWLKRELESSNAFVEAKRKDQVPDMTFSLAYTRREFKDSLGDFVGAAISFPVPVGNSKSADRKLSLLKQSNRKIALQNYLKEKKRDLKQIEYSIQSTRSQLKILSENTVSFSQNARSIQAKTYALGETSYSDLLQSEVRLRNLQLRKIKLQAQLESQQVKLKFIRGDKLHD